jgi:hypothetical protein
MPSMYQHGARFNRLAPAALSFHFIACAVLRAGYRPPPADAPIRSNTLLEL